jgi:hypothetical protein
MFVVVRGDFGAEPEYMRENMCCVRDASSIARRAQVHLPRDSVSCQISVYTSLVVQVSRAMKILLHLELVRLSL